jgi:hypothetical protein
MGKTISLGTENGEHDYLIMGKTISLGTENGTISLGPSWVSPSAAGFCLSFALNF